MFGSSNNVPIDNNGTTGAPKASRPTSIGNLAPEHDPEKACPGLGPGWKPVFGKDHAPRENLDHDPNPSDRIMV
jgi:hypothetical protein